MAPQNNIFAIDVDAVLRAVQDANSSLAERHRGLMNALHRAPKTIGTEDDINRVRRFATQLKDLQAELRETRLSDTASIKELLKRLESYFKAMENEASWAYKALVSEISEVVQEQLLEASRTIALVEPTASEVPMVTSQTTGEVFGTIAPVRPQTGDHQEAISMTWKVSGVDRECIDLEALRPFITENALQIAARHHLRLNGPNSLKGVTYIQEANL
jgi:hypothetical protein